MTTSKSRIVPLVLLAAGVVFLLVSILPMLGNRPLNTAPFVVGVALVIVGAAVLRKAAGVPAAPRD
jgi:hypothetical protein